jgi:hypothetical protein
MGPHDPWIATPARRCQALQAGQARGRDSAGYRQSTWIVGGRLLSTGGIAQMSWGALLAQTGSIVLALAALTRPRDARFRATAPTA